MTQKIKSRAFWRHTFLAATLFVVAAGMMGLRSAQADAPLKGNDAVQKVACLIAGQSMGSTATGASLMQILWGGTRTGDKDCLPGTDAAGDKNKDAVSHRQKRCNPAPEKHTP